MGNVGNLPAPFHGGFSTLSTVTAYKRIRVKSGLTLQREIARTRLDNMENKSEQFWERSAPYIAEARARAKRNNEWMRARGMVNQESGEILQDQEGETLTLEKMSKSWYLEQGARNNAFSVVKRSKKIFLHKWDVKKYRPKFITLTFADVVESWRQQDAIAKFLDNLRKWAKKQGIKTLVYFWVSEVQMKNERGALHYHILVLGCPFILKATLERWWGYGFVDVEALDDVGRAVKYLLKYLWKWGKEAGEPDELPDWWFLFNVWHKRRYGFSKWFALPLAERLPRWLKNSLQDAGLLEQVVKVGRAVGGGWNVVFGFDGVEGVAHFPSPFKVLEL